MCKIAKYEGNQVEQRAKARHNMVLCINRTCERIIITVE
jgi:hypothetical protein